MTVAHLIDEGMSADVSGWDLSRFGDRIRTEHAPWGYTAIVAARAAGARAMLDPGTGGGEWPSGLVGRVRPPLVVATEGFAPNVPVAAERLRRDGVPVVWPDAPPDNAEQDGTPTAFLPFRDGSFDLVNARHESYVTGEVARVLKRGGTFVTQQVHDSWTAEPAAVHGVATPSPPARAGIWRLVG